MSKNAKSVKFVEMAPPPGLDAVDTDKRTAVIMTVESGAADNVVPRDAFPEVPLKQNHWSKTGKYFLTANGAKVYIHGAKTLLARTRGKGK